MSGRDLQQNDRKSGAALIAGILLVGVLFVLGFLYLLQVRLESRITRLAHARAQADAGLFTAQETALAEVVRSGENRGYVLPGETMTWHSSGELEDAGWIETWLAGELGWPERLRGDGPESLSARSEAAGWEIRGSTNTWHLATRWVAVDLTGGLDPTVVARQPVSFPGPEGIGIAHMQNAPAEGFDREFLTSGEFTARHPGMPQIFVPGNWGVDRGWYDRADRVWRTNLVLNGRAISMFPMTWDAEDVREVMAHVYPDRDAAALTDAFLDFREVRPRPERLDGITAVPIPMFNEAFAEVTLENEADRIDFRLLLNLEIWFPYVGNPVTGRFRVAETPEIRIREGMTLAPLDTEDEWVFEMPVTFSVLLFEYRQSGVPLNEGEVLNLEIPLSVPTLEQEVDGEWVAVDRMAEDLILRLPAVTVPPEGGTVQVQGGLEVLDPRLNHQSQWWEPTASATLGAVNQATETYLSARPDLDPAMAHTASLDLADHIRYFPLDTPWESVDLFGEDGAWWMRHTRDTGWEPGIWRRGRVNPNSLEPQTLEAVFVGAPVRRHPGAAEVLEVSEPQAWQLAEAMIQGVSDARGGVNRGSWVQALRGSPALEGMDRMQAEALAAQVMPRFEAGGRLTGMILEAEWRAPGGNATARQRAASVVWQDPVSDENGVHLRARTVWLPLSR